MAAEILQTLSVGDESGAKEAVAIYAGHLYFTRPEAAKHLINAMLHDPDDDIRRLTRDTLNELASDKRLTPTQAAHLLTEVKTAATKG